MAASYASYIPLWGSSPPSISVSEGLACRLQNGWLLLQHQTQQQPKQQLQKQWEQKLCQQVQWADAVQQPQSYHKVRSLSRALVHVCESHVLNNENYALHMLKIKSTKIELCLYFRGQRVYPIKFFNKNLKRAKFATRSLYKYWAIINRSNIQLMLRWNKRNITEWSKDIC